MDDNKYGHTWYCIYGNVYLPYCNNADYGDYRKKVKSMNAIFLLGLLTGSTLAFGACFAAVMVLAYRATGQGGDENEAT